MIMESYGEEYGQNGDGEETDTYGDEAPPPEYTAADEGYEGREGESDTPQRQTLIFGIENQNIGDNIEDNMQISNPDDRESDFLGESQHGCSQIFIRPGIPPQPGDMVAFDLPGIPDFRAQYEQNLLQWQKENAPREVLQIEEPSLLQTAGPPEVSQPLDILSRDGSIQACESEISQDSYFFSNTQVGSTHQPQVSNLDVLSQSQQQSQQRANPLPFSGENLPSSGSEVQGLGDNSSILEEIRSLGRRF